MTNRFHRQAYDGVQFYHFVHVRGAREKMNKVTFVKESI